MLSVVQKTETGVGYWERKFEEVDGVGGIEGGGIDNFSEIKIHFLNGEPVCSITVLHPLKPPSFKTRCPV